MVPGRPSLLQMDSRQLAWGKGSVVERNWSPYHRLSRDLRIRAALLLFPRSSLSQLEMAAVDAAFRSIPKNATYFLMWRIENMQIVPLARDHYGTFYTGDSYIVVCATESGEKGDSMLKVKESRGPLDVHIHFWLGAHTSQDEAGVAAYKTVELDDYLGGVPVQHREVQGWESKRFISYFRKGIRLLEGGIASGISNMNNNKPKMFRIKGKQRPIVQQMPEIDWQYMDDGSIYIICIHSLVFVWAGRNSNTTEKIQGVNVAQQLKSEFDLSTVILVEDGKEQALSKNEKDVFNQLLSINQKKVKNYKEVLADDRKPRTTIKLYRCVDEGGTLKVTEVKPGPLEQKDLDSQDSFIIDNGESGIWVWVGRKASQKERTEAMRNAQGFIKKKGYPNHTQVTRVIENGEPPEFKAYFHSWHDIITTPSFGKQHSIGKVANTVQTKFDATTLHTNRKLAAESQMVDDGTGSKEVFCVEQTDLIPLDVKEQGKFYSGNCYVTLYAFSTEDRDHFMIYYWLGRQSLKEEQDVAALKAIELDQRLKGLSVLTRVMEGKEPSHFLAIFRGRMMTFQGRDSVGIQNGMANGNHFSQCHLLHVQGTSEFTTKAMQVEKSASSLNSYDVFVLFAQDIVYIWAGKRSTGDEREMAKRIASQSGREVVLVSEGQERDDFWKAIGGKKEYSHNKRFEEDIDTRQARFFQCVISSGHLDVHEIIGFDQSDLVDDDVVILDAWNVVFLWLGHCTKTERRRFAVSIAEEYLLSDPSGRQISTPVIAVKQGNEPPNFTGFFPSWDTKFWNKKKTYEEIKAELTEENAGIVVVQNSTSNHDLRHDVDKFPIEVLRIKDTDQLPAGIDPSRKEVHLTDDDFKDAFGMTYTQFQDLPRWKQLELKKAVDLF